MELNVQYLPENNYYLQAENNHMRSEIKYLREHAKDLSEVIAQITGKRDPAEPRLIHPYDFCKLIESSNADTFFGHGLLTRHPDYDEIGGIRYKQTVNMPIGFAHIEVSNLKKTTI